MTSRMTEILGAWIVVAVLGVGVAAFLPISDHRAPVVASVPLTAVDVPRSRAWQTTVDPLVREPVERYGSRLHTEEDGPVWTRGHMPAQERIARNSDACPAVDVCLIGAADTDGLSATTPC